MVLRFEKHYRIFHVLFLLAGTLILLSPVHLFLTVGEEDPGDPIYDLVRFLGPGTALILWPLTIIQNYSFAGFFFSLFSKASIPVRLNLGLNSGIVSTIGIVLVLLFRFNPFHTLTPLILLLASAFFLGGSSYLLKRFDSIDAKDKSQLKESRFLSLVGMSLGALILIVFVLTVI